MSMRLPPPCIQTVADIARGHVIIGKKTLNGAQLTDLAAVDQQLGPLPLGVMAIHEAFHDFQTRMFSSRRQQLAGIGSVQAEGFFTQHVFAGRKRLDRPLHMEVIGQGDVDGLGSLIGQQVFVRSKRVADAQPFGGLPGLAGIT